MDLCAHQRATVSPLKRGLEILRAFPRSQPNRHHVGARRRSFDVTVDVAGTTNKTLVFVSAHYNTNAIAPEMRYGSDRFLRCDGLPGRRRRCRCYWSKYLWIVKQRAHRRKLRCQKRTSHQLIEKCERLRDFHTHNARNCMQKYSGDKQPREPFHCEEPI